MQLCVGELTWEIHTGVITLEVYAEDVELPKIFGSGPSDLRKFSLGLYLLAAQYIPETYTLFSPQTARNTYARRWTSFSTRLKNYRVQKFYTSNEWGLFLVFDPSHMGFQFWILERNTMPPFVEFSFPSLVLAKKICTNSLGSHPATT